MSDGSVVSVPKALTGGGEKSSSPRRTFPIKFPRPCDQFSAAPIPFKHPPNAPHVIFFVGLCGVAKRLYYQYHDPKLNGADGESVQEELAGVNSFDLVSRDDHLLLYYTDCVTSTLSCKVVKIVSGATPGKIEQSACVAVLDEEARKNIERRSTLVKIVPRSCSAILLAPRGNFETVFPLTLVRAKVRDLLATPDNPAPDPGRKKPATLETCNNSADFFTAFVLVKKHRLPYHIVLRYGGILRRSGVGSGGYEITVDPKSVSSLVRSIGSPDGFRDPDLAIFLANLTPSHPTKSEPTSDLNYYPITADTLNRFYHIVMADVAIYDTVCQYPLSYLTSCAKRRPPDLASALHFLKRSQEASGNPRGSTEKGLRHLLYFTDIDSLYDEALGTYDLGLALMVAQHSQKDPKEYLRQLKTLEGAYKVTDPTGIKDAQDTFYGRYMIDLARKAYFPDALANLARSCCRWDGRLSNAHSHGSTSPKLLNGVTQEAERADYFTNQTNPPTKITNRSDGTNDASILAVDKDDIFVDILARREAEFFDFVSSKEIGLSNALLLLTPGKFCSVETVDYNKDTPKPLLPRGVKTLLRHKYWATLWFKKAFTCPKMSTTKAFHHLCAIAYNPDEQGITLAADSYAQLGLRFESECLYSSLSQPNTALQNEKGDVRVDGMRKCMNSLISSCNFSLSSEVAFNDLNEPQTAFQLALRNLRHVVEATTLTSDGGCEPWSKAFWYIVALRCPNRMSDCKINIKEVICTNNDFDRTYTESLKSYSQLLQERLGVTTEANGDVENKPIFKNGVPSLYDHLVEMDKRFRDYCDRLKCLLRKGLSQPLPPPEEDVDGAETLSFDDVSSVTSTGTLASQVSSLDHDAPYDRRGKLSSLCDGGGGDPFQAGSDGTGSTPSLTDLLRERGGMIKPPPASVIKSRMAPSVIVSLKSSNASKSAKRSPSSPSSSKKDLTRTATIGERKVGRSFLDELIPEQPPKFMRRATLVHGSPFEHVALAREMATIMNNFLPKPDFASKSGDLSRAKNSLESEIEDIGRSLELLTLATPYFDLCESEACALSMGQALAKLEVTYVKIRDGIMNNEFNDFICPLVTMSPSNAASHLNHSQNSAYKNEKRSHRSPNFDPKFLSKSTLLNDILKGNGVSREYDLSLISENELNLSVFEGLREQVIYVLKRQLLLGS